MAVSDIYDTFFIDHKHEFRYIGCKDEKTLQQLNEAVAHAVKLLTGKNNGKYEIMNDIDMPTLDDAPADDEWQKESYHGDPSHRNDL